MLATSLLRTAAKIICKDFANARLVTLNKPKVLNALDLEMVHGLHEVYISSPAPPSALYILKGAGEKGFCAGGDVVSVTTNKPDGCSRSFFYWEYQVDHHIMHLPSSQVCLWNGFVMGGGVGLSLGSKYRVATEKACFAMPETAIGMIPDVGASWFLPRLQTKGLGLYLGLTGHRVRGSDLVQLGLATHYVSSERLGELEAALCNIADASAVTTVLEQYAVPPSQLPPCSIAASLPFLESTFGIHPSQSISKVVQGTHAAACSDPLAEAAAAVLPSLSPTSLLLTLEVLKRGAAVQTPADAFRMEYCVTQRLCAENDFTEGVRALLIDKDKSPKWRPSSIDEVTAAAVNSYFEPTYDGQPVWDPVKPLPSIA